MKLFHRLHVLSEVNHQLAKKTHNLFGHNFSNSEFGTQIKTTPAMDTCILLPAERFIKIL